MDIAKIIGKNNFEKLKKHLGGNLIWIPKTGNLGTRDKNYFLKRNNLIRYFRAKGLTIKQIAKKFSLSKKRVCNILTSYRDGT